MSSNLRSPRPRLWLRKLWTRVGTYGVLAVASQLGVLLRYGLGVVFARAGFAEPSGKVPSGIFPDILANALGCSVMGAVVFQQPWLSVKLPSLYLSFTTGFAGSLTTFSAWMTSAAFRLYQPRVADWFLVLLVGLSVSFFLLFVGLQLGLGICLILRKFWLTDLDLEMLSDAVVIRVGPASVPTPEPPPVTKEAMEEELAEEPPVPPLEVESAKTEVTPELLQPGRPISLRGILKRRDLDSLTRDVAVVCSVLLFLLFALLTVYASHPLRALWLACCFGPPGTWIRYELTLLQSSPRFARLPICTLFVNVAGSILSFSLALVRGQRPRVALPPSTGLGDDLLDAVVLGFCGCLTTVSTFTNETRLLVGNRWRFAYVTLSLFGTQALLAAAFGLFVVLH